MNVFLGNEIILVDIKNSIAKIKSRVSDTLAVMKSESRAFSSPEARANFGQHQDIATSGKVQHLKSAIHGLPVTLRMLRVKSDKSDWLRTLNDYSAHVQRIGPSRRSRLVNMNHYLPQGAWSAVTCYNSSLAMVCYCQQLSVFSYNKLNHTNHLFRCCLTD